jgi:sugar O-acyltransferase (sialic acid O-acetyltransferase NeuD family)
VTLSPLVDELIFWGATGQAKVLRECLGDHANHLVAVFDNNAIVQSPFTDVPIFFGKAGFKTWLDSFTGHLPLGCLVAIGGERGKDRLEIQDYLEANGLVTLTVVHKTAFVAEISNLGRGSQVCALAAVCVEAKLGRACIVNTGATVDHECVLGDGVHISPGAHLAGNVIVEDFATIYSGAVVIPHIHIGCGAVVGAGAVVIEDVPPHTLVVGNPARIIRELPGHE